jgi:hypothetical protein
MHVYFFPAFVEVEPSFVQAPPAFAPAAIAVPLIRRVKETVRARNLILMRMVNGRPVGWSFSRN